MEIPRHWRLKAQRYRLEGSRCPVCGQLSFPPRPVCLLCNARPDQNPGFEMMIYLPLPRLENAIPFERTIR